MDATYAIDRARRNADHCRKLAADRATGHARKRHAYAASARAWDAEADQWERQARIEVQPEWAPAATKAERTWDGVEAGGAAHAVLSTVNGNSEHQAELVDSTGLARSTVRRVLRVLEAAGLVDFDEARTEADKVAKYWIATDDGEATCAVLDSIAHGYSKVVDGELVEEGN